MSIIQFTIRVAWSLAVAVVAGAILVILHISDVYPERRLAFAVLGVIADPKLLEALQWAAVAAVAVVSAALYNVVAWRLSKRKITSVDTDPFVPLKEAATIAYEETRGTKAALIVERQNRDDILGYYAHALFNGKTTLYGNHPASRKLEVVPNEEYGRCGFSDDQKSLRRHGENRNLYENLQIKRSDLDRRVAELKSAATARHEVRLSDALYRIIDNSDWGPGLGRDGFLDQAAIILRQAAKDGEIAIRGRREISGYRPDEQFDQTWDDIDRSYWQTHEFEMTAVMCVEPHYATRETVVVSPSDITAQALPHYAMLRVWNDELEKRWPKNDKESIKPIISAELEATVPPIDKLTPACTIRVTNTGPELKEQCLVQIENHGLKTHMPDPLVIRTEGQIRGKRTSRFTLSTGQPKLVPILFRDPAQIDHFRFIGEDGKHYPFSGDSAEFVVAIYGAAIPTRVRIRLSVGQDWKINSEMEYC